MNEIIEAVGYVRVSTAEQCVNGLSLESQRQDIEEYCRAHGYRLGKIYIDKGITARKKLHKRQAFMEMMQDVKNHKINHIVILRLDRFFRNVYDYHRMMNEYLVPNGCGWSAVKEDYDTTTTNGRLMINLRLAIAEQECDQDSDRIKDVQANRVKDGFVISGHMAYGYSIDDNKRLIPNDDAKYVREMFKTFSATQSVHQVMNIMNNKYSLGLLYGKTKRVLSNSIYIGRYRGNDNFCEPLISEKLFGETQEGMQKNIRVRVTGNEYIFTSLVKCPCCGYNMCGIINYNKYGNAYKYYRCNNSVLNNRCSNYLRIPEHKIEEYLVDHVDELLNDYVIGVEAKEKSLQPIVGNRKQIEGKIERLKELFVNGIIGIDELKRRKAELESQIIEDSVPPKKDLSAVTAFLNSGFRNIYNDLSISEKNFLWRSVIKEIQVKDKEITSIIFL